MYYMSADYSASGEGYTRMLMIGNFVDEDSARESFSMSFGYPGIVPEFHNEENFLEDFDVFIPQVIRNAMNPEYQKVYGTGFNFTMSFHV